MFAVRRLTTVSKFARAFSTESPKATIAKNAYLMEKIFEAKSTAELEKIAVPKIDIHKLPPEIAHLGEYFKLGAVAGTDKYIPDPTAWQNMGWWDYSLHELKRTETFPTAIGFILMNIIVLVLVATQSDEARLKSPYIQLLESRKHGGEHAHEEEKHHH